MADTSAIERQAESVQSSERPKRASSAARAVKNETTRARLIDAAAKTIGKHGYAGCTIARVTRRARVAHGAFYLHFTSQQELFDQLLPALANGMLGSIAEAIRDSEDIIEFERKGLIANFDYIAKYPYMHRVTTEAELYAPKAFKQFLSDAVKRYAQALERHLPADKMITLSGEDLEAIAAMLMGARFHLFLRFIVDDDSAQPLDSKLLDTYLRFIAHGLGVPLKTSKTSI